MRSLILQGYKTVSQYGLGVFMLRLWNYSLFKLRRVLSKHDDENDAKFQALKGKYAGKRVFILGNGPSLNLMSLYQLKDEYTMCFNRFPLMYERVNWKPNFYAVTDDLLLRDMPHEINQTTDEVDYAFFPDLHPSNLNVKKIIQNKDNVLWIHVDKPDFSDHLPDCGINKTVVNAGIQIAAWMGFSEIYLIGVDMTFGDHQIKKSNSRDWKSDGDDPNHFDPRYFGKGRKYHNPGVDEMLERFAKCQDFFESRNVHIYNAGQGGRLEAFPRVKFEDVLQMSDARNKQLFYESIQNIEQGLVLEDFPEGVNPKSHFKVDIQIGANLIKKMVLTHVPLGPYNGMYYFIKRRQPITL